MVTEPRRAPRRLLWQPRQAGASSRQQREEEAQVIRERILETLETRGPGREDFLTYRFQLPLIWYGEHAPKLTKRHEIISLGVIAAGLISSGLTAIAKGQSSFFGEITGWLVIGLGVVVGLGTGFIQLTKPSQRAIVYGTAQDTLRREGWDLVHRRNRYAGLSEPEAFGTFVDIVLGLEARTRSVEKPDDKSPSS